MPASTPDLLTQPEQNVPVVLSRDGVLYAMSTDVAAYFGKEHKHVLRDIRNLAEIAGLEHGSKIGLMFTETEIEVSIGNDATRKSPAVEMTQDGFALLTMGFTGKEALGFKLRYIERFNEMARQLAGAPQNPMEALSNPDALRGLLLTYAERQIALEGRVQEMAPKVQAYKRIAESDGSFCITDAAKTLQVRPKDLFMFLRSNGWIYSRPGVAGEVAYQAKLITGLLEHKTTTVTRTDGSEKTVTQVRVTSKGLARLGQELQPTLKLVS